MVRNFFRTLILLCAPIMGMANAIVPITFVDLSSQKDSVATNSTSQANGPYIDPSSGDYVVYDPKSDRYIFYRKQEASSSIPYKVMNREEYQRYRTQSAMQSLLLQQRSSNTAATGSPLANSLIPSLQVGGDGFDRIFGSNSITIVPRGSVELIFGVKTNKTDNPLVSQQFRRTTIFDFQSKLQMNVTGMVGEKLKLDINYNTEATFDFENNVKIEYTGTEDEIIQKIEAGNISFPLPGTLITGQQSLFGFKTQLKFGDLTMTSVLSRQRGESQSVEIKNGAQNQSFSISAANYDANRHFLLGHYFRENYDKALSTIPLIQSGINITKIEIWITNKTTQFENARNIVAFVDLAENKNSNIHKPTFTPNPGYNSPANEANSLYNMMSGSYSGIRSINQTNTILAGLGLNQGEDFEKLENARLLNSNEYTINSKLGFISLNTALNNDEILGVAYEYILNGKTYKVGELSSDGIDAPKALIVKLLKGTNLSPKLPNWSLMMKNVYSIGAYQLSKERFYLDVLYEDSKAGTNINYLPEGDIKNKPLLKVMNLDNLNSQGDPSPDGVFDFVNGVTILTETGKIIFPVLQPFGKNLRDKIGDPTIANKYVFQELYDSSMTKAKQTADKNKFLIAGTFQSSSGAEISLNAMNIPQGSVVVTAGGMKLAENIDYTVDYMLGRVRIINQSYLQSGTPIKVSLENQALYNMQTKTLLGTHFDYRVTDNFHVGATILNLTERPLTQKVNYSDEPISNTIWGMNVSYQDKAPWLTSMVQKIPFIDTKAPSSILFEGEFAHFIPGHSKAIGSGGNSYIDDFEGAKIPIDLKSWNAWSLASTPQGQTDIFPEGMLSNDLAYGFNRARLAWYSIDPIFLRNNSYTPSHIKQDKVQQSNHFVREIREKEIFPEKDEINGISNVLTILNLAYYPNEKGPYNYDTEATTLSRGITPDGFLRAPETRWGGIMRSLPINDFEQANIDYIEFWMMDPFVYDQTKQGGELIFNLGNISEDILRDGRKSFENGLPTSNNTASADTTAWGRVPTIQSLVNAFDNDATSRKQQDVGLDGLSSNDEQSFFHQYLEKLAQLFGTNSSVYQKALIDPSNDDYHYYRGSDYDNDKVSIIDRYKRYNSHEGNSPSTDDSGESYSTSSTSTPDGEDINKDNTLSDAETYFQYKIPLTPSELLVGKNFITDKREVTTDTPNGPSTVSWYQFKIPVSDYEKVIGSIQDFKSIRFMRMLMRGFKDTTILRFAKLELVKGEWRKYSLSLKEGTSATAENATTGSIDISTVNLEENSARTPVNYILPPGISRVTDPSSEQIIEENEQAMQLRVIDLEDGDSRAAFKNTGYDMRQYKRLKMAVHAEAIDGYPLRNGDLSIFLRMGSDFTSNYYEYEIPLHLTPYGTYSSNRDSDRETVWPSENEFNIALKAFTNLKLERYDAMRGAGATQTITKIFSGTDGANIVRILGNPSLSNIKSIMVGVRNPSKSDNIADDGLQKSCIVWLNELRLNNFDEESGWAANARVMAKMADFGVVSLAGSTMTSGYGSLESKLNERNQANAFNYDIAADFELGKFFPEKAAVRIPMHIGYSESVSKEKYSPTDQDLLLKDVVDYLPTKSMRDSLESLAEDLTVTKSLNFTNVGVGYNLPKLSLISPSNFSLSYAYTESYSRTPEIARQLQKHYRGSLNYAYNSMPKYFEPLSKMKNSVIRSPYLRLIRDFNIGYKPSQLSFISEITRNYSELKVRNLSEESAIDIPATYAKDFYWNRIYALQWDFTKSLKLMFSATNLSRIDEPDGIVDKRRDRDSYRTWKDSVWENIANGGRTINYNHAFNITYNLPINKIPMLNWVSASAAYNGGYNWEAGSTITDSETSYWAGNTITNSSQASLISSLNMVTLYNKIPFLKAINLDFDNPNAKKKITVSKTYKSDKMILLKGRKRIIYHGLDAIDVKTKVFDADGKPVDAVVQQAGKGRVSVMVAETIRHATVHVTGKVPYSPNPIVMAGKYGLRALMGIRNVSATYTQTEGTILPGYRNGSSWFGTYNSSTTGLSPTIGFILGEQDADLYDYARQKGWLVDNCGFSDPFVMTHMETASARMTFEPIKDLIVDFTATRSYQRNRYQYGFESEAAAKTTSGNFSISVLAIGSAFEKPKASNGYESAAYNKFLDNRAKFSQMLGEDRKMKSTSGYEGNNVNGFYDGYSNVSQDVLIPAFLTAYTSTPASKAAFKHFIRMPYPNWTVRYQGLSKFEALKPYIQNADFEHSYRALYTIGGYSSNSLYDPYEDGFNYVRNAQKDFTSRYEMTNVSLSEFFNPLFGVNIGWANNLQTQVRLNKNRTVALSLTNNQITEIRNSEWDFQIGYRFDNPIRWINEETQTVVPSYMKVDLGLAFNNSQALIRKIVEDFVQPSDGRNTITIKGSADYTFNERLNIRLFYDRVVNKPLISTSYPTANTSVGFSVRYNIGQ